jgi:signal recognition particle subunit SRP54
MEATGLTGVIITKMDGTGKAGGALSAVAQTGVPVYMIGTGEHLEDFEIFSPKKFLGRLLGMGDPEALLDVAQEADISDEKAEETMTKIMSGRFNLMDMYDIWEKFAKPSLMKRLFDSIPVGKMPKGASNMLDLDAAQEKIGKYTVILDSMTYKELENPEIINAKVIRRVSRGSGTSEQDVRNLLKEFRAMKENAKMMKGNRALKKMMRGQMKGNPDLLKEFED